MAESDLTRITDEIYRLTSRAMTSADREERTKAIEEGLAKACETMQRLTARLRRLTRDVLEQSGLSEEHEGVVFREVARSARGFEELQTREAVLDFLDACEPLLVQQLFLSKKRITELVDAVREVYDRFMDQHVGFEELCEKFERLKRFFCRPPYDGGGGGPLLDGGPESGPSKGRGERICTYLSTFAAIGSLLIGVLTYFASASGSASALGEREQKLALLSLLALSGFSDELDSQEDIPSEERAPVRVAPAAAEMEAT